MADGCRLAYLLHIGGQEFTVPGSAPPANAANCAAEGGTCTLPAGVTATVWYGAGTSWVFRAGVTGSVACSNAVFGDPLVGTVKACRYVSTPVAANVAPAATAATSHVSPWETLAAVNDNIVPANSADRNGGAYGNWQGEALYGRTDRVSLGWSAARTLTAFEVHWWNDGLALPRPPQPPWSTGTAVPGSRWARPGWS